jgi:DNA-binding transcriptional ArsR family regulator
MTESENVFLEMIKQNHRDDWTMFSTPFVGNIFQDLMQRSGTEFRGKGLHRFTDAHMLYVLCLCGMKRVSRQELSEATGIGEGAIRNLLSCLRKMGLIETTRRGTELTPEGIRLRDMTGVILPGYEVSGIVEGECNYVILARGKGHLLDSSIIYRDAAIRVGAKDCMLIRMDAGKVASPYRDIVRLDYPDLSEVVKTIGMNDGDAAVICGAGTLPVASASAFGGLLKLLSSNMPYVFSTLFQNTR